MNRKNVFGSVLWLLVMLLPLLSTAQIEHPVHWSYAIKKLEANTYAVFLRAKIDEGWHIYAQKQSKDAIAIPSKLKFEKAAGVTLLGAPVEQGKKEKYTLKEVGITNYEYAGQVDFVQQVRLDAGVKEIKGSVIFQSCTHTRCLPEDEFSFTVAVPQ